MTKSQRHDLEWRDGGVPVSLIFDDPFFSLDNGLDETRYVFLDGNDLPARFCDGFEIAELGFGTGLNFLAALASFRAAKTQGCLHFTSFEAFPLSRADTMAALAHYPELPVDALAGEAEGIGPVIEGPDFRLEIILGDARETLAAWQGKADAWFLDGFAPAKNPELWEADILSEVANHTKTGGSFATYTAVGDVRRALQAAGFQVERIKGFGRKRHMSIGRKT